LPEQLILPIDQHVGDPAQPLVGIGERVLKGQLLAESPGTLGAPVHASSSGKVVAIEPWPVASRHGEPAPCIVIECDGEDRAVESWEQPIPYAELPGNTVLQNIMQGGIVGLGGAVYPTAQKLMQAVSGDLDYLILNGAECEPYISCDDMLMRERAHDIVSGANVLLHALGLDCAYIVVESDKPAAIQQLAAAMTDVGDERLSLKQIPTERRHGRRHPRLAAEWRTADLPHHDDYRRRHREPDERPGAHRHTDLRTREVRRWLYRERKAPGDRRPDDRQVCHYRPGAAGQGDQLHTRDV
jgi:Na+-translocating ferredoxin:NAD+ oxidoreductase RnfC subunit